MFILYYYNSVESMERLGIMNKLNYYIKTHLNLLLFFFFFMIYFTYGLYITFFNESIIQQYDIIFNADSPRIINDFLLVNADHYRTKVHPLQLILLQPIFLVINTFLHSPKAALLMGQAICSAATVIFIKNILYLWTNNHKISLLVSIIYGFSFSTLVFTSIPETYIFAAFFNALLFYYLSLMYTKTSELTNSNYLVIAILTVFAFGIIPISIISNFILILFLLKGKISVKIILKLFCLMLMLFTSLTLIQKLAHPFSPIFFKGAVSEDINYTNSDINFKKIGFVSRGMFVESLYSLKLVKTENTQLPNGLLFFASEQNCIKFIPAVLIFGFMLAGFLLKKRMFLDKMNMITSLSLILFINFVQSYFYGASIAFLYSQNSLLYLIILLGIILAKLSSKISSGLCIAFILYQSIVNIPALSIIEKHVRFGSIKHYHFGLWLLYAFISTIILYLILRFATKLINNALLELSIERKYFYYLIIFIIFILINSVFLSMFKGGM